MSLIKNIAGFYQEVRTEVMKCTRPTVVELRESTVVVVVTMAILGVFIFASDLVISNGLKHLITNY